jgi:leucyl/phenylalanyl-tRNA--protein transferase
VKHARRPIEPPPSPWLFPPATDADENDVVGVGADLEPGTLLLAYRNGLFPMPVTRNGVMAWWSPDPRGVFEIDGVHVSRSLHRSARRFTTTVNRSFDEVVARCADLPRPGGWITPAIRAAYGELHRLGWAHSVEVRIGDELVGGLYGVCLGGVFAGESMFHTETDASKVALWVLRDLLDDGHPRLIDAQWLTTHLESLGARAIDRRSYLARLRESMDVPFPAAFQRLQ